jgi:hypothetical protein
MSTRKITKEQFSEGTTIDGNRIEEAMDNIEERFNDIPKGDLRSRFVQTQYVLGFEPQVSTSDAAAENLTNSIPFLIHKNSTASEAILQDDAADPVDLGSELVDGAEISIAPAGFPYNEFRQKGTDWLGSWVWSITHMFQKPVIIQDVMWMMAGFDTAVSDYTLYPGTFRYGATPPEDQTANYGAYDASMVLQVASPYAPEDRRYDIKELAVHNRQNYSWLFNYLDVEGTLPSYDDFRPNMDFKSTTDMPLKGIMYRGQNINIPIPRDSKVTLYLSVPTFLANSPYTNNASSSVPGPPNKQTQNVVITVLEELVE